MADNPSASSGQRFWCLSCGVYVEGEREVREFPVVDKTMVLTTVRCVECGLVIVRSSTMREARGERGNLDNSLKKC